MTVSVRLVPMTEERYKAYREHGERAYGDQIRASGGMPEPEARQKAADDYARLLPDGLATPGHLLWTVFDGDDEVGVIWLHVEEKSDGLHAFGYDLEVREDLRRRGYGRAVMKAAEDECRSRGVVSVGLNVFGFNRGAQDLYEQMGFEVTATQMRKRL